MKKNLSQFIKKTSPLWLLTLALLIGSAYWITFHPPNQAPQIDALTRLNPPLVAKDFSLLENDGFTEHTLSDLRGEVVIINLWATWCPPCRAELPSMNRAYAKLKDKGVVMYAINFNEEVDAVNEFIKAHPIDFPVLMDFDGKIAKQWGMKGLPTTYVVNRQGKIVYEATGERPWDDDEIIHAILSL